MSDVTVRPLIASDRPDWEPLWQAYLSFYKQTLKPEVTEDAWAKVTSMPGPMGGLAAFNEHGQLVGFAHYLMHPVTWSVTPRCYLEDLFVDSNCRGGGTGRALIEAVYSVAAEHRCEQVYWVTDEKNAVARRLYDRVAKKSDMVQYKHVFSD